MLIGVLFGIISTLIMMIIIAAMGTTNPMFVVIHSNLSTFQAMGSLAIAGSAIVAFFLYRSNINRHQEEDDYKRSNTFLKESVEILERAFETFTDEGENVSPPRNSRLLWLTTARMIIRYENLKVRISKPEHIEIVAEHEEFWRFQFYGLLDRNKSNFDFKYYSPLGHLHAGENVSRNSIAVIFDFSRWKEGVIDPMDEVDDKLLFAAGAVPPDQFGTKQFLEGHKDYWDAVEKIKVNLKNSSK